MSERADGSGVLVRVSTEAPFRQIVGQIRAAAELGGSMLVSSTDLADLARLCDRVIVMRGGCQANSLSGERLTISELQRSISDIERGTEHPWRRRG